MLLYSSTLKQYSLYFILHTLLRFPDSLQHGQIVIVGELPVKVVVLSVLFQGKVFVEILIKKGKGGPKKLNNKKGHLNIIFR